MTLTTTPAIEEIWEVFAVILQNNQKSTGFSFFVVCFAYHKVV